MPQPQLDTLCLAMTAHDAGDPKRIQHFMKVSAFAALIARGEGLPEEQVALLTAVGYIHDIGIRVAEERLGYQNGKLQEELGPEPAREMLRACGASPEETWTVKRQRQHMRSPSGRKPAGPSADACS